MKLLALDPSSTRTGYAIMPDATTVAEAGYLRPEHTNDDQLARVGAMVVDLRQLIAEQQPEWCVIEIPSGRVHGRITRSGRIPAGLSVYGFAVGRMYQTCADHMAAQRVTPVTESLWTDGDPKRDRQLQVAAQFPEYRVHMQSDGGADVADAIGVGLWWFRTFSTEARGGG